MAKYSRFDPRNKKSGRNKQRSIERDLRIHEEEKQRNKYRYAKVDWVYNEDEDEDYMVRD